jgi:hypothetical protein
MAIKWVKTWHYVFQLAGATPEKPWIIEG